MVALLFCTDSIAAVFKGITDPDPALLGRNRFVQTGTGFRFYPETDLSETDFSLVVPLIQQSPKPSSVRLL